MQIVSIGDLVADIYFDEKENIIGIDGGVSSCNIVCNLSYFGFKTKAYGVCGDDYKGLIAIKSLQDCGVETDILILPNFSTKTYIIRRIIENSNYAYRSIKYCPYCGKGTWYDNSYIDEEDILKKLKKDDVLVFDNLNIKNQYIIDKSNNIKLLDLGSYQELEYFSNDEIIKKIKNKFAIINLNERVEKYLINRLSLKDNIELYKIIKAKLIIVTKSIKGSDFIYRNKVYSFPLEKVSKEIDDSGAGDMFFSVIIKNWLNNNFKLDSSLFYNWFNEATKLTAKIVTLIGSRTHIKKMYDIKKENICSCKK